MSVGSWTPDVSPQELTVNKLTPALQCSVDSPLAGQPADELVPLQPYASSSAEQWQSVLSELDSDQLRHLCRFFTLAEHQWTDWQGGDRNPVIWLCKELKKRGEFPDKALTIWIKEHTDNRYLPYGNPLG